MALDAFSQDNLRRFIETCDLMLDRIGKYTQGLDDWEGNKSSVRQVSTLVGNLRTAVDRVKEEERYRLAERKNRTVTNTRSMLATAFASLVENIDTNAETCPIAPPVISEPIRFPGAIFSVIDVLRFLHKTDKTGNVVVASRLETFRLVLQRGELTTATSDNNPPELRLGRILIAQGAVDPGQLEDFLARHAQDRSRLGRALEAEEVVTREQVMVAVKHQVGRLFQRLLELRGVDIVFEPSAVSDDEETVVIRLGDLLLH